MPVICLSVLLPNLQVGLAPMVMVYMWDHVRGRREARGEGPIWLQRWGGRELGGMDGAG